MKYWLAVVLVIAVVAASCLCGCGKKPPAAAPAPTAPSAGTAPTAPAPSAPEKGASEGALTGKALGEQIFLTGNGADGKHIAFEKGAAQFKAKPGGCADCHGKDAKGQTMGNTKVPDIRASVLLESHGGKPAQYTPETLKRAVTQGLDESAKPLGDAMPRWKLTDDEFNALADFVVSATGTPAGGKAK